ncbi:uncharacterized protein EV420DRAFT_1643246 [Desarmillaria tabescens]|uniref:F-box domain-containing protein n=1 Tax=Armillaria tabescens TaxID=1929756 RepID=A0AA39KBZ4_ARMTA|nr:uncharacterized protein EV420DRAFT_1643246 [Desarmillaria tabescens]KAK0458362.1 hypothetical protein EV420DRAFT_1643246 [Desarmillaria tabescens]
MPLLCPCRQCNCRFGTQEMVGQLEAPEYTARFNHLLATNDVPLDEEIHSFAAISAEKEELRNKVRRQITHLRDSTDYLLALQEKTEWETANYNTVRAPLRRLPDDMLSEIFFQCVDEIDIQQNIDRIGKEQDVISSLDYRRAPWLLTRVCKHWRAVALSHPRLWSIISVNTPGGIYAGSLTHMQALELQLQRSGTCPLSVALRSTTTLASSHTLQLLISSSPRWKKLLTAVPIQAYRDLCKIEGNLPLLEEFYGLTTVGIYQINNAPALEFTGLRGAPILKKIAGSPGILSHISLHTPRITAAEVLRARATSQELVAILGRLPSLERSSLICMPATESGDLEGANVTLAHLRHLSLPMSTSILAGLTLPALTTLTLKGDISIDTVLSHLQRSRSTVREITIALNDVAEADCTHLLNELSSLEVVVVLTKYAHTPAFIQGLFETSGRFTALRRLTLKGIETIDPASLAHVKDVHPGLVITG